MGEIMGEKKESGQQKGVRFCESERKVENLQV